MKNKKLLWGFLFIIFVVVGIFGLYKSNVFSRKDPIYLAVTVLGDAESHAGTFRLINSIQLYLDQINDEGGVDGHPLKLEIHVDGGNPEQAAEVAAEVADSRAIISLGNTYSDAAQVAGQVYQERHMPVMTSGATAPFVTEDNDWFFRVLSDNAEQGRYLAQYAYSILGYKTATIVYEDNSYGISLGEAFAETFEVEGGKILQQDPIISKSETLSQDTDNIVASYEEEPELVFIATYKTSGTAMVNSLHGKMRDVPLMGGDDVGDAYFAEKFVEGFKNPEYLNGVYAASPLIYDVGSESAQKFRDNYIETLGVPPTWFSATTYDSAIVAVEALRNAGISGFPEYLKEDRQKIRDYLASIDSPEKAIEGITGHIYFNEHHNFAQPMAMGVFQNKQFISAPIQLASTNSFAMTKEIFEGLKTGKIIKLDPGYAYKTQIVYVGIDINEFTDLDIDGDHTYFADFYLWFRYQDELDFSEIFFDNSENEIALDNPLEEKTVNGMQYRLYHIRDTFTDSFDLSDYPFDHQQLQIKLRHSSLQRKELIFVTDFLGLGDTTRDSILQNLERARAFDRVTDWQPVTGYFFADTIHEYSTRGDPTLLGKKNEIERSRFNTAIEIKRDVLGFTAKTMMPIFWIIVLAYLGLFLPGREFDTITGLMTGTVLSVVFFHVGLAGQLNVGYTVALDNVFYIIYALLATALFLSIIAWHKSAKNEESKAISQIFWFMRLLYPIVLIGVIVASIVIYDIPIGSMNG